MLLRLYSLSTGKATVTTTNYVGKLFELDELKTAKLIFRSPNFSPSKIHQKFHLLHGYVHSHWTKQWILKSISSCALPSYSIIRQSYITIYTPNLRHYNSKRLNKMNKKNKWKRKQKKINNENKWQHLRQIKTKRPCAKKMLKQKPEMTGSYFTCSSKQTSQNINILHFSNPVSFFSRII